MIPVVCSTVRRVDYILFFSIMFSTRVHMWLIFRNVY